MVECSSGDKLQAFILLREKGSSLNIMYVIVWDVMTFIGGFSTWLMKGKNYHKGVCVDDVPRIGYN